MSSLQLTITDVGRAALVNAQNTGTTPLVISEVAIGAGVYIPDGTEIALANEIKRIDTLTGGAVSDDIIHVTISDESVDTYTFYEFGLYTNTGVLFAVYSQAEPLMIKGTASALLMAVDIAFIDVTATELSFPDQTFNNPPASTDVPGVVRLQKDQLETDPLVALRRGSFGLGKILEISDANLAVLGGLYSLPVSLGAANAPLADTSGVLYVANGGIDESAVHQIWCLSNTGEQGRMYTRHYNEADGWSGWLEMGGANSITLDGPLLVYPGTNDNTYFITNYDSFSTYQIVTQDDDATAVLVDDTLTLTVDFGAPEKDWHLTLSRNGVTTDYVIHIGAVGIVTPEIDSPDNGVTDVMETVTVYSSIFATYPPDFDTHHSTRWQISTTSNFSNIVFDSLADTVNLDEVPIPEGTLDYLTMYYARVRYTSSTGLQSEWSTPINFTTRKVPLPTTEIAKILASDGRASDRFGWDVSMSDDKTIIVVSAPFDNSNRGAVYVYENDAGSVTQLQKLTAWDAAINDVFGRSVRISGDGSTILVGADGESGGIGAVYEFTKSGSSYVQGQKLVPSDGAVGMFFGFSVDINTDASIAIVGTHWMSSVGAAYVFNKSASWTETIKLQASDGVSGDDFGRSVAINNAGDTAVIGAPNNASIGAAYIFTNDGGWGEQSKLVPNESAPGDDIGMCVDISGDASTVIIGCDFCTIFSSVGGSWTEVVDFSSIPVSNRSVSLSADGTAGLIGRSGTVLLKKEAGTWLVYGVVQSADYEQGDNQGFSVVISADGKTSVLGSPYDDDKGTDAGAAYLFS